MNLSTLQSVITKKKRRIGLGHGSGRGKTAGRGTKGQKARGDVKLDFEGGALPLKKRLPFLRGKGKFKSLKPNPFVLAVSKLNVFSANATVDLESLAKHNLVSLKDAKRDGVKILSDGELQVALTVKVAASKAAVEKIEKAGGSVIINNE